MGKNNNSKLKLGYHLKPYNAYIKTKIISVLLVLLLVATTFSSISLAQRPRLIDILDTDKETESNLSETLSNVRDTITTVGSKITDRISNISLLQRNDRYSVVTVYNGIEKTTRLRRFLPTTIDINDDGTKDIRVIVLLLPGVDLNPPAIAIQTRFIVSRLPAMDDIKNDDFEIYLEMSPSKLITDKASILERIRLGYQSPEGEEIPKTCIITYRTMPRVLYPLKKTAHRLLINPGLMAGKTQLNLIFNIADIDDDGSVVSGLDVRVDHDPIVRNQISFERSKDYIIRRGQTLEISRKNAEPSNISLFIRDIMGIDNGTLAIKNIPEKISLSWLLGIRKGYLKLNTHGSGVGNVQAAVKNALETSFTAETGLNFGVSWDTPGIRKINKGEPSNIRFDTSGSALLSDFYLFAPTLGLSLTASALSLKIGASADVGGFVIKPALDAENLDIDVENVELLLEDCNIKIIETEPVPRPTVDITYPSKGDTVTGLVKIEGIATAPEGRTIELVEVYIDGEKFNATGTTEWSYELDTTELLNGKHKIKAVCYDSEGFKASDEIVVTVDNPSVNWYPTVEILTPSQLDVLLNDVVNISGTSYDYKGTVEKVEIRINDGEWIQATGTTEWFYEWDISQISGGRYYIYARSYDGEDYTIDAYVAYLQVFVRFFDELKVSLSSASVDINNLVLEYISLSDDKTSLTLESFNAEGSGFLTLGDKAVSLGGEGKLGIVNTSIYTTNASDVRTTLLENLAFDFQGEGYLELSKGKLALGIDASLFVSADSVIDIKNITFGVNGKASADIIIEEKGSVALGEDTFSINITDLFLEVDTIVSMGAERISANGKGAIYIEDGKIILSSDSIECNIDKLFVNTDLGVVSVSGNLSLSQYGEIKAEFFDLFNFNVSYEGLTDINITDFEFKIISSQGVAAVNAKRVNIKPSGYARFSYYEDDLNVTCCIDVFDIKLYDLILSYNDSFYGPFDVQWDGKACFTLNSDIFFEYGSDWICITIGGNGRASIYIETDIKTNGFEGYLNADITLTSGDERFVICLYNLGSDDIGFNIDGSAILNLELFELYLKNCTSSEEIVDISLERFMASFEIDAAMDNSIITLIVKEAGISLDNGHVCINIQEKLSMSLYGTVDVTMSASLNGFINFVFNETGLNDLEVEFTGDVNIEITGLKFTYVDLVKSTDIYLDIGVISINGNADIHITKDYIEAGIGVGNSGILIEDFLLNANISLLDFNVIVEFDILNIVSGVRISISDGIIIIDTSGDITWAGAQFVVNSDSNGIFINADIGLFESTGGGGGKVIISENLTLINGSTINTNFVFKNTSIDVIIKDLMLFLILEDADISFVGSDVTATIDFSDGFKMDAVLAGDSYIKINTLWSYLTYFVGIEIRAKNILITGPTTIIANVDMGSDIPALVTIHAEDGISADEFTLVGMINMYELEGGPEISIGVDKTFNFIIGIKGLWNFKHLIAMDTLLLNDLVFEGEINPVILGFGPGFSWLSVEGTVLAPSNISFSLEILSRLPLNVELEPGTFALTVKGLDGNYDEILKIDLFVYSDAPIKLSLLDPVLPRRHLIEGIGLLEINLDITSLELLITGERNIDIEGNLKVNGDFKLFKYWDLLDLYTMTVKGSGECYLKLELSGSIFTGDLYGNINMNWQRTRTTNITFFNFFSIVTQNSGEFNRQIGGKINIFSGEFVEFIVESEEASIVINQTTQYITVFNYEGELVLEGTLFICESSGEIQVLGTRNQTLNLSAIQINGTSLDQILNELLGKKRWFLLNLEHINSNWGWVKLPLISAKEPVPIMNGAVTLLARKFDMNEITCGTVYMIPGDKLNFTAWFRAGSDNEGPYTFVFNYGDDLIETVYISEVQQTIKVHPSSSYHMYTELGTYTVRITVIDNKGDTVTDTLTVKVIEKYLGVAGPFFNNFNWDFERFNKYVDDDGKIHDSFKVFNKANFTYSPDAIVNWSIDNAFINKLNDDFGTDDWYFDIMEGTLLPGESQIVNFSFTPNLTKKGDYDTAIYVNNSDTDESIPVSFIVTYGLVQIYPGAFVWWRWTGNPVLFVRKGEINEFNNVFWVHSKFWETLEWEVYNKSHPNIDDITIIPESGVIYPGDSLTPVSIIIDARDEEFSEDWLIIEIQRVGDPLDNDGIGINMILMEPGINNNIGWVKPDSHVLNWWFFPRRAYDNRMWTASSYRRLHKGWTSDPLILKLDEPIDCDGFRINAKADDNFDKIEVKLFNDNTLQFTKTFTAGEWEHHTWTEWSAGESKTVNRAEIKMHLTSGTFKLNRAKVWEFDFKQA
jgi:hypothetical protein